ncbi:hypothetical protein HHI36_016480 [Cryptolaemus montrouzieri]|uniref:Uncharacterized protein n=1 Tax=Cryptolaemus montrouzieri TaxID=559131 RepID=A0ABD2NJT3_9CUCU
MNLNAAVNVFSNERCKLDLVLGDYLFTLYGLMRNPVFFVLPSVYRVDGQGLVLSRKKLPEERDSLARLNAGQPGATTLYAVVSKRRMRYDKRKLLVVSKE